MTNAVSGTEREEDSREKEQEEGGVRARERDGRHGSRGSTYQDWAEWGRDRLTHAATK